MPGTIQCDYHDEQVLERYAPVVTEGELADQLSGILGGALHSRHAGCLLTAVVLQCCIIECLQNNNSTSNSSSSLVSAASYSICTTSTATQTAAAALAVLHYIASAQHHQQQLWQCCITQPQLKMIPSSSTNCLEGSSHLNTVQEDIVERMYWPTPLSVCKLRQHNNN